MVERFLGDKKGDRECLACFLSHGSDSVGLGESTVIGVVSSMS